MKSYKQKIVQRILDDQALSDQDIADIANALMDGLGDDEAEWDQ